MRIFLPLLLAVSAPAFAQPAADAPVATLAALARDFPAEHAAIAKTLEGKSPEEARRLVYVGIDAFLHRHRAAIVSAPARMVIGIEARHGGMLRALQRRNFELCARIGDRGFFSSEALAGPPPPLFDEYGVALVAAARSGSAVPAKPPTKEDFETWIAAAEKIEPDVPIRTMLNDRAARASAKHEQLCRGAAAMHEAVSVIPESVSETMARLLLSSVIDVRR